MTDQTPKSDSSDNAEDALARARENGEGKTIDGEFIRAADPASSADDSADITDQDFIIAGTRPDGSNDPGGQRFAPDDEDEIKGKKKSSIDPDFAFTPRHPLKRLKSRNLIGHMRDAVYGIQNGGDYFRATGQQVQGPGVKELTDAQLQEILIRCVLEKGWNKIYFYNGNKPDYNTARRASMMLSALSRGPKHPNDPFSVRGPLYDAAMRWNTLHEQRMQNYNDALASHHKSGGRLEHPGNPPKDCRLDAVMGRMDPMQLPLCFNPARHERLRARETDMMRRGNDRKWFKETLSKIGLT